MADRTLTARTIRKGFAVDSGGGGGTVRLKNKRIATAAELGLAEHLAVLDEATELPPFGFNIAGLEQRLERRLGLEITPVRCLLLCSFHRSCRPGFGHMACNESSGALFENVCFYEYLRSSTEAAGLYVDDTYQIISDV